MRDPIRDYDSRDLNDFKDWSVMDIADLKNHAEFGASLKKTASFLCRAGSLVDVAQKAEEFGLKFSRGQRQGPAEAAPRSDRRGRSGSR
jgi:hypothetical protein